MLIRFGPEDINWHSVEGFELAIDRADAAIGDHITGSGYEPHVAALLKRTLHTGMTVVDIGANIGFHTILAAKLVGNTGRVIAFEPNTENCRLILLSKARNAAECIELRPVALAATDGFMFFSPAMGSNGGQLPEAQSVLMSSQCMVVPTQRLDDLKLEKLDFIKIDVEGGEANVFLGAQDTLKRLRPLIVSEFSPEMLMRVSRVNAIDYLKYFFSLGYSVAMIEKSGDYREIPISHSSDFMSQYGSAVRIEDLVFRPI